MGEEIRHVILIGMPGAGKSTVGKFLARALAMKFIDTDTLIEERLGRSLQDIVNREGHLALREIEEETLLSFDPTRYVVATGGSAVYSRSAMEHLKVGGVTVFLDVDLETLESRIDDFGERGIARRPGQSFAELFDERYPLYTQYADITIHNAGLTPEAACDKIIAELKRRGKVIPDQVTSEVG